ncbi:tyrosine-type recombinase/integrase [Flexivirga meconopsidis]|uniref:tyrosine-type recombinase/integrase n=1 Tax=Flexivirga meconopsidis TaxID=2977121 RepID=UPI00223EA471
MSPNVLTFGDDTVTVWDANCLGRPANQYRSWGRIAFKLDGSWLYTAKVIVLVSLSPSHPVVVDAGIRTRHHGQSPLTAARLVHGLRLLRQAGVDTALPKDISGWTAMHFDLAYRSVRTTASANGHDDALAAVRAIHHLRPILPHVTYTGAPEVIWSGTARRTQNRGVLSTETVDPSVWRSTIRAALAYVQVFSADIIAARETQRRYQVTNRTTPSAETIDRGLLALKAIPVRAAPNPGADDATLSKLINRRVTSLLISDGATDMLLTGNRPSVRLRRAYAIDRIKLGYWTCTGLHTPVARLDGQSDPWTDSLDAQRLNREEAMLRVACYLLIAALTFMRDNEVQELRRGCVTRYYGLPAVESIAAKGKSFAPRRTWWVNEEVVQAITILERRSPDDRLFVSTRGHATDTVGFDAGGQITEFIKHVRQHANQMGLEPIPEGRITPHMLRRTMAMIAAQEPHGEIAAGIQLGHVFRRAMAGALTAGYTSETKNWRSQFLSAEAERSAQDLTASITAHGADSLRGPGARRIHAETAATIADKTLTRRLLTRFPDLHFGTFSLCLGDRSVAKCVPEGSDEPLELQRCEPDSCTNCVITATQRKLWEADRAAHSKLLRERGLAQQNRDQITSRIEKIDNVLRERRVDGSSNTTAGVGTGRGQYHGRDEPPP